MAMRLVMFMQQALLIAGLSCLIATVSDAAPIITRFDGAVCPEGLIQQPQQRYAVYVFCQGNRLPTIGILRIAALGNTASARGWRNDRRFWQEGAWVSQVSAIAWDPSADILYVAAAPQNEAAIYKIDLEKKIEEVFLSIANLETKQLDWHREQSKIVGYDVWIDSADLIASNIKFALRLKKANGEHIPVVTRTAKFAGGPVKTTASRK